MRLTGVIGKKKICWVFLLFDFEVVWIYATSRNEMTFDGVTSFKGRMKRAEFGTFFYLRVKTSGLQNEVNKTARNSCALSEWLLI